VSVPRPRLVPLMVRELRGAAGRMAFFVLCLAVGVAAVVAVAGVSEGLDAGLRREGRRLLAADLVVQGPEPMPAALGKTLQGLAGAGPVRRADLRELVTMVSTVSASAAEGTASQGGPAGRAAEKAPPPGRRESLTGERSTRASARPASGLDGRPRADADAGLDALRAGPSPPPSPPTGSAAETGNAAPLGGASRRTGGSEQGPPGSIGGATTAAEQKPPAPAAGAGDGRGRPSSPRGGEGKGLRGRSQLVELKVVDGPYPFYGDLVTRPAKPLAELLAGNGVVAAPELLEHLGLAVGDRLYVGGLPARVTGVVESEPDSLGGAFGFSAGPRLFVGPALFDRTGLETTGSRIRYRTLVALPPGAPKAETGQWAATLRAALPADVYRVQTWTEAQPALRRGLARAERFLGLVALLSLLVGGIGVGQTVRAWLAGRLDAVAVLECIGLRPREVALVYAGQVALLGLAGSLVGAAAGVAVELAVPRLASGIVPPGLIDPFQPAAVVRGLVLGVGVALLFGLPSLGAVLRVPPVRVLRRTVEPLPVPPRIAIATTIAVLAGVWTTAAVQADSPLLGAQFTAGALLAATLLGAAAWGVSRLAAALPRERAALRGRFWLRHGLASLARPGAATLTATVALGLGVLVVVALWLVEHRLTDELVGNLPEAAPSVFLVDIQPDQWDGVRGILEQEGATHVDSVPVVMARLAARDGVPVRDTVAARNRAASGADGDQDRSDGRDGEGEGRRRGGDRRWALTREQRLTYLEKLPPDNKIVAGSLWSDPNAAEVSVEEDFAHDLGIGLGSTLTFDVQGVPIDLEVTSLRTVDWSTFGINFFLVVEPGVLDKAPQFRIAAARLPPDDEVAFQDRIAAEYPNVTVLRVGEILEKVVATLRRIADGVRFVGGFTVLAGMAILAGAVSAGAVRRRREVALLKTLGTTRAGVVAIYTLEYGLVGLVAGAIGCGGAAILAREVLVRGMDMDWAFAPLELAAHLGGAVAVTVALSIVAGLAASVRALQSRPADVLLSR